MYYCYINTTIGDLLLAGDDGGLSLVSFPEGSMRREPEADWIYSEKPFTEAKRQFDAYFAGTLKEFDLPLKPTGTEFQLAVLDELRKIPYGTTTSYADIARRIGRTEGGTCRRRGERPQSAAHHHSLPPSDR